MAIVSSPERSVKRLDIQAKCRRDVAIQRAAQALAISAAARFQLSNAETSAWAKENVRAAIVIFERMAFGSSPEDVEAEQLAADRHRAAVATAIEQQQSLARLTARNLNHDLGAWRDAPAASPVNETAACRRCGREAHLVIVSTSPIHVDRVGAALLEGCLVAAESTEVR